MREERGDRGLGWYLDQQDCYSDCRVTLSDSSAAEGQFCWLGLESPRRFHMGRETGGDTAAHMDVAMATKLRDALDEWLAFVGAPSGPQCQICEGRGRSVRGVSGCMPCGSTGRRRTK